MKVQFRSSVLIGIASLFAGQLPAQGVRTQEVIHCKASELDQNPIQIGALSLTISRFKNSTFKIKIQNSSENFIPFSPDELTIVGSDGSQNYITNSFISFPLNWVHPTQIKIAPQAHIDLTYSLSDAVKLPAKIYYSGKSIAAITK